jgi:glutaredoxin
MQSIRVGPFKENITVMDFSRLTELTQFVSMTASIYLSMLLCLGIGSVASAATVASAPELEVFVRPGCPFCEAAKGYLRELEYRRPGLYVRIRDISVDPEALRELRDLAHRSGVQPVGVPAFYLRGQLIVGFLSAETTGKAIEALLDQAPAAIEPGAGKRPPAVGAVDVPFLGRLHPRELGLPVFTMILGLLDGFNPCAMWVLLFLLSVLVNLHDRKKMFLIGGTFVAVSGIVYFAFMVAWFNLFLLIGASRMTQVLLGSIAALIGVLNVKDAVAFGWGPSVGIPEAAKPGIFSQVRRVLRAENLVGAVTAVIVLAVLVNTVELLCTAGIPAIFTQVLTMYSLPNWGYYAYLVLYNLAYVADDGLMLAVAVVTLSREKLQQKGARWLKLISGVVMLALGLVLLLRPNWLAG